MISYRNFSLLPLLCLALLPARAEETWQSALARMPLRTPVAELSQSNCVNLLLDSFCSNQVVKALIFMPGATDEFYMFRRAKAELTNAAPSLLDAIAALTNQTEIRATFHAPLLLLHTEEDPLKPVIVTEDPPTARKIAARSFLHHALYKDCDWAGIEPDLRQHLKMDLRPWRTSSGSWHFYRHSFAAWNLTGWEALEATALAGKTRITIHHKQVLFEPDPRVRIVPKLKAFPR